MFFSNHLNNNLSDICSQPLQGNKTRQTGSAPDRFLNWMSEGGIKGKISMVSLRHWIVCKLWSNKVEFNRAKVNYFIYIQEQKTKLQ